MKHSIGSIVQQGHLAGSRGVSFTDMRVLGSYALIFLTRGGGSYQLAGGEALPCRAGDMLVVFPEIAHGYGPEAGCPWDELYMVFEGTVFDLWRQAGWLTPKHPILRPRPTSHYAGWFRRIMRSNPGCDPAREGERICELQHFLAAALRTDTRAAGREDAGNWPAWMDRAVQAMQNGREPSMRAVASTCGLSYESFRKKFRHHAGESPARYRDRLLITAAKKLIYEQRLTNKELAASLGICDEFHFSKRFRQIAGQSPSSFRRGLNLPAGAHGSLV